MYTIENTWMLPEHLQLSESCTLQHTCSVMVTTLTENICASSPEHTRLIRSSTLVFSAPWSYVVTAIIKTFKTTMICNKNHYSHDCVKRAVTETQASVTSPVQVVPCRAPHLHDDMRITWQTEPQYVP